MGGSDPGWHSDAFGTFGVSRLVRPLEAESPDGRYRSLRRCRSRLGSGWHIYRASEVSGNEALSLTDADRAVARFQVVVRRWLRDR